MEFQARGSLAPPLLTRFGLSLKRRVQRIQQIERKHGQRSKHGQRIMSFDIIDVGLSRFPDSDPKFLSAKGLSKIACNAAHFQIDACRGNSHDCRASSFTNGASAPTVHQKGKINAQNYNCDGLRRSCFPGLCTTAAGTLTRQSRCQSPAVNSPNSPPIRALLSPEQTALRKSVRSRIEAKGFKNISALQKDDAGVWRGKASQGGKAMNVSVDFQGNVVGK